VSAFDRLNEKQKCFVHEYLVDFNATQAAIRAGYSRKSARDIGYENLTKPDISEAVAELAAERARKTALKAEDVVNELKKLAFCSIHHFVRRDEHGTLHVDTTDATPEQLDALKRFKTKEYKEGRGEDARVMVDVEIELPDKVRPLELLGKHLGMWKDQPAKGQASTEFDTTNPDWQNHIDGNVAPFRDWYEGRKKT
jgi:phage terminase small subunit